MDLAEQLAQTNMLNRKVLSRLDKTTHKFDDDPFSARNLGVALQKLTKGSLFKSIGSSIQDSLRTKTSEYLRVVPFMENRANKMMERVEDNAKLQDLSEDVLSANNKYKKLLDHLNSGKIATEDQLNQVLDDFKNTQKEIIELQTQQLQVEAKYLSGDALQANFALQQELVSTLKGVDLSEVSLAQDKPLEVQTTVTPEEERIIENRERKNTEYLADNYKETVGDSTVTLGQKIDELREDVVRELRRGKGIGGSVAETVLGAGAGAGVGSAVGGAAGSLVGTTVAVATAAIPILLTTGVLAAAAWGIKKVFDNPELMLNVSPVAGALPPDLIETVPSRPLVAKDPVKDKVVDTRNVKAKYSPEAWRYLLSQTPDGTYDARTGESLLRAGHIVESNGKYVLKSQVKDNVKRVTAVLPDRNQRGAQEREAYVKAKGESAWEDTQVKTNTKLSAVKDESKAEYVNQYGLEAWGKREQSLVKDRDNWVEKEWAKKPSVPKPVDLAPTPKTKVKATAIDKANSVNSGFYQQSVPNTRSELPNENKWNNLFEEAAAKYNVDPLLLKAMAKQESKFDPEAVSPEGATGLMQLMPGTAKDLGVKDRTDPRENVMGGAKYMAQLLKRYNDDPKLALAAYNWGMGNLERNGKDYSGVKETREYVDLVTSNYEGYKQAVRPVETTRVEPNVDVKDKKIDNYVKTQVTKDQTVQVNPAPAQPSTSSPTVFSTKSQDSPISPSSDFYSDYGVELLRTMLT